MHTLDSFSNTFFLHESLWSTFKTVYAHRKNGHGCSSLHLCVRKAKEKLQRTHLLTQQSMSLSNCTFLIYIQHVNGLNIKKYT